MLVAAARNMWWPKALNKLVIFAEKSIRARTDTIFHIVLKFQVDHACFHGKPAQILVENWNKKKTK